MRRKLFASLVNVSEGRRGDVVKRIELAASPAGRSDNDAVALLHTFSDLPYNRTVFTVVGEAGPLATAIRNMCMEALRSVDLREHDGGHPRAGVIDLVPVHPLSQASLLDAAVIAKQVAQHLSAEGVTCVLYGAADDQNRTLVQRRKELKWYQSNTLKSTPAVGWTAVGATPYVMNCNATVSTRDLKVGRAIAAAVRQPGAVESMAFPHKNGNIEIACNLTKLDEVTPQNVVENITAAAQRLECTILDETIIGYSVEQLEQLASKAIYGE